MCKTCSVLRFRLCCYISHCSLLSTYYESLGAVRLGTHRLGLDEWYIKQDWKRQLEDRDADERKALAKDGRSETRVPKNIPTVGLVSLRRVRYCGRRSILSQISASRLVMAHPISLPQSRSGIWFLRGRPPKLSTFPAVRRLRQGVSLLNNVDFVMKQSLMTAKL